MCKAGLAEPLWQDVGGAELLGMRLKEGKEKPQKVKDVCLFIVEVNMGSRLERVLL